MLEVGCYSPLQMLKVDCSSPLQMLENCCYTPLQMLEVACSSPSRMLDVGCSSPLRMLDVGYSSTLRMLEKCCASPFADAGNLRSSLHSFAELGVPVRALRQALRSLSRADFSSGTVIAAPHSFLCCHLHDQDITNCSCSNGSSPNIFDALKTI